MIRRALSALVALLGLLAAVPPAGVTQAAAGGEVEVVSGVAPDTVTVGDPFRAVVRVAVPAGVGVEFTSLVDTAAAYQPLGPGEVRREAAGGDGRSRYTAAYPLVAWRTGALPTPLVELRLALPEGSERRLRVALAMPHVRSVLPADTIGVEPRGAKGILGARRGLPRWLWAVLALLLLLLAGALGRAWTRARRRRTPQLAGLPPRERALAELEHARSLGLVEAGEWKTFFTLISDAVRRYVASLSPRWGADLTTGELVDRMRAAGVEAESLGPLRGVLERADLVKFARYRPTPAEAEAAWEAAWRVVEELDTAAVAREHAGAGR